MASWEKGEKEGKGEKKEQNQWDNDAMWPIKDLGLFHVDT